MPREHPFFRAQMEALSQSYPGVEMFSVKDGMAVTGIKSENTYIKHFGKYMPPGRRVVSKVILANYMIGNLGKKNE